MDCNSSKPLDQIRSADRSVEEIARHTLEGAPQQNAEDRELPYRLSASVTGGLSEPGAVAFDYQPDVPPVPQVWNPVTLLAEADHNGLPGVDVLEALLYLADPNGKCRHTAEQALQMFGSVGAVLSARVPDLTAKLGIRQDTAYALKAIHTGMRSVLQEPIRERIHIGSYAELIDYVGLSLKHEGVEVLRMLYLDR